MSKLILTSGVQNVNDNTPFNGRGFKEGGQVVGHLHGKYYEHASRGNVFVASTLAAGIVVPFVAATLSAKFTLHNPAASGVVVELIDLNVLQVPGSALITGLGLAFQGPLATTGGVPTSTTVTAGGNLSTRVGGGGATPASSCYTAATLTNVAIANLTPLIWLFNNVATTVITQQFVNYQFDGKFILRPDSLCTLVNSITGTQSAAAVSLTYAEHPA